ncbi:MAG: septation ring formation regulator EzrA [Bacteroidia bacterium]|jgi:septation ring formation regulator EzrA
MNDLPLSKQDFERYQRNVSLLKDVVAQINKDFRLSGFDVEFSGEGDTAYQELSSQLVPVIEYMLENQTEKFWNLIYGIDLSETKVKEILFGKEETPNAIGQLTDLILKRQLQKVVIRHFYSGKQLP